MKPIMERKNDKTYKIDAGIYFLKGLKKSKSRCAFYCSFVPILTTLFCCLAFLPKSAAQEIFNMQNLTVDDCEGILLDSEEGDVSGTYDHNENLTFTICVPDVDEIILSFTSFCTEDGFDSLRVYDGPDTLSILLGTFMGTEDPPTLIATSGCMTINFVSDPNVVCTGWVAMWTTEFEIPEPIEILPIGTVPCESNTLSLTFAEPIPCDSVYAAAFSISGPQMPNVISTTPSPCTNGFTNTINLTFDPIIDFSGDYLVRFINTVMICEETFILQSEVPFSVIDCPLNVELMVDGNVSCAGDETTLIAEASGGNANNYAYSWSVFAPDTNEIDVIVWGPTWYFVTVTDGVSMASDSILVTPNSLPTIMPGDTTICQSVEPFTFGVWPPGGEWWGAGIGEDEEESGLYDPALVQYPQDTLFYEDPNGCVNNIIVTVTPLDEGTDDASCVNADSFLVSGGLPVGGAWSGPFISPEGFFMPDSIGSFEVIYTHPNGCIGSKFINVDSLITMPPLDSLCESDAPFEIAVTPFGGIWSGPGILDVDTGEFSPDEAGQGNKQLIYEINGCADTLDLYVTRIDATGNISACPMQVAFNLPGNWQPMGVGVWSGTGIIDSIAGIYDPSLLGNGARDTLWLEANGCVDFRIAFIRQTEIQDDETRFFCPEDEPFCLDRPNTGIRPRNGNWSGPGITNPSDQDFFFNPDLVASGTYTLYYERNTCVDSMEVVINPTPEITPMEFCDAELPQILEVNPSGGIWSGTGIINEFDGIFHPGDAGAGLHTIYNESDEGCVGEGIMTVIPFVNASLEGVEGFYCFQDTEFPLTFAPAGGIFVMDGDTLNLNSFNPAIAGTGTHLLQYTFGEEECADTDAVLVEVGEAVGVDLPFLSDTLCTGENISISALGNGGSSFGNYTYTWNQGLGFGQFQLVTPENTTNYTVTVDDGCSDVAIGSIEIFVHPPIFADYVTGEPVCYVDSTWAEVFAFPGNDYSFIWNTNPPTFGNYIEDHPVSHTVEIIDNETGCSIEEDVQLPGWDPIQANFDITPTDGCVSSIDPTIQLVDFSVGGTTGWWDFGDSLHNVAYNFGENLSYTFQDTGIFTVTLSIQNEGGCASEYQVTTCVKPEFQIFAPNAMSPNRDGVNDFFKFVGVEIEEISWQVYDRYGLLLYEGFNMEDRWDGTYNGEPVIQGGYVYYARYHVKNKAEEQVMTGVFVVIY